MGRARQSPFLRHRGDSLPSRSIIERACTMIPDSFETFFLATAGTGGAFIGLLFVAISIVPQRTFDPMAVAGEQHQRLAEATLLTLVNGFVVSSIALIPGIEIGWVAILLGAIGVFTAAFVSLRVTRVHRHSVSWSASWRHLLRVVLLGAVATVLYAVQCLLGLQLLLTPEDETPVRWLALILIGLYIVGIVRAWTLLGDPQGGWSGWLNPLQDIVATREMAEPLAGPRVDPSVGSSSPPAPGSLALAQGSADELERDRYVTAIRAEPVPRRPAL